jgi:dTDP-4-dehydrorhamnose 3,5-epimerase
MTPTQAIGIEGALLVQPTVYRDSRGFFFEIMRASWLSMPVPFVQWNVSRSAAGVVRGLHFHRLQSDYWHVIDGRLLVALVDLRPDSPTHRVGMCLEMDAAKPTALLIPPGVVHGYRILSSATLLYLVDNEYSGKDEYGVRWNDPALGLPPYWYDMHDPILSARDSAAPLLKDAPAVRSSAEREAVTI